MNSFNVYGQSTETIGGNTPVWLGTVKPVPVGARVEVSVSGTNYGAGTAGVYNPIDKTFQPIGTLGGGQESQANAYLYNDIHVERMEGAEEVYATCALVMHHPEGLLIERVYPEITEEQIAQLQAKIPGVLLVRG